MKRKSGKSNAGKVRHVLFVAAFAGNARAAAPDADGLLVNLGGNLCGAAAPQPSPPSP